MFQPTDDNCAGRDNVKFELNLTDQKLKICGDNIEVKLEDTLASLGYQS